VPQPRYREKEKMINVGASDEIIEATENEMGVNFPEGLKEVWRRSNGLDLPGGWRLFPVFDNKEPRKTCNHIGYENTKGRWSYMNQSLISIAGGDTGNQLVLKKNADELEETIYLWNHETNKIKVWGKDFEYLKAKAEARLTSINKAIARSTNKR
jgi:hypothetical protein